MAESRPTAGRIRIHKIAPGQGHTGCHPRGVQVHYKESTTLGGHPVRRHLAELLERQGYEVKDGHPVSDTPIRVLCVARADAQLTAADVEAVLRADPDFEFVADERPEGSADEPGGPTGGAGLA